MTLHVDHAVPTLLRRLIILYHRDVVAFA